jgi:hypothetical protein
LTDLLQIGEWIFLALHDGSHAVEWSIHVRSRHGLGSRAGRDSPTESSLLELLASEQTIAEFNETAVVLADLNDQVAGRVELTQSELVVVLVVQDVEES